MFGAGLEQAGQSRPQVGGAADVGFGVGLLSVEGEDGWGLRELGERGFGVGGVEGDRL